MAVKVTYSQTRPNTGTPLRHEVDFRVIGNNGSDFDAYDVLVDSGADFLQIPEDIGIKIGLLPGKTKQVDVSTVGGTVKMELLNNVEVEVEGKQTIYVDVLFHPDPASRPLFGRNAIWELKALGLDPTDWHWQ